MFEKLSKMLWGTGNELNVLRPKQGSLENIQPITKKEIIIMNARLNAKLKKKVL